MAIVLNTATQDGDVIVIKTGVPIVGIVALTAFADTTENETGSIYFEKTFRYSINGGLTFTDWIELTTVNVQNIVIERLNYFVVEYRYKRIGTGTPNVAFDDVTLSGTVSPLGYPVFHSMVFALLFSPNEVAVLQWALNVLEKLYKSGIIPNYIIRNQGGDDSDYTNYWFSITHFFAILVYYARSFENIPSNILLMKEYVKGRGVYLRSNPDLQELYYVYSNYINEIQRRGTSKIWIREGEFDYTTPITYYYGEIIGGDLIMAESDGELLRLLDTQITDEFLFALTHRGELGWCIGESSPLYTGTEGIVNLIKGYEFTEAVEDLDKYPLINPDFITLVNQKMVITGHSAGDICGIGVLTYDDVEAGKAFIMDSALSYEISFKVKKTHTTGDLTFGVILFDENGTEVTPQEIKTGVSGNWFFENETLPKLNTEYWVRAVLHSLDTATISDDVLTIGFGQGLRSVPTARYFVPVILVDNVTGVPLVDSVTIYDIKVRPAQLWFSRGLMSAKNMIIGFLRSHNTTFSSAQVERIIDEELLPYNTFTTLKFL